MNYAPGSSVMPFNDESRVSRITVTNANMAENSVNEVTSTIFDQFFLIFDELGRCLPLNSILVFLQIIISFYQYYITSFFPFLPNNWDFSKFPDKIIRYLSYPNDFGLGDEDILRQGIPCYFIVIFDAILILYLLGILSYYHVFKMFPKYNIHITRFVISFIIPIILTPTCYNIGFSFNSIFQEDYSNNDSSTSYTYDQPSNNIRKLYIVSTFFSTFFFLILLFVFYMDIMFRSSTPYLENTPLSMWDGIPVFLTILGSSIINLSSRIIKRLPTWSHYFLIACCILYNLFILYRMLTFPMVKQWMNIFISLFVSSAVFVSLFQLFPIPSIYRIVVPFSLSIVLIPVITVFFHFFKKKTMSIDISKESIASESGALRYLRIHIAYKCEEFVSFNWVKVMNHFKSPEVFAQVAQIISFFPSESHNLTFYISFLSKNARLSFKQRFLFFQLHQVHVLRQSNTSKQLNEDLAEISKATNKSISLFSQFLIRLIDERQSLSIDGLHFLARINRATNSICHEAMTRYPNNSRLLFIFSRFVIECQADFKGGVIYYHEGQMIERGKRTIIDLAFQSMVNLFPVYLWKKILNYKGQNILHRKHSKSGSSMSQDSLTNDRGNKVSDSDFESNEKITSSVITNSKLRFALKKSVNNMHSKGITILTVSTILRFIMSFIACITVIIITPSFLEMRSNNYETVSQINVFRKKLDLCLFRTAKLWSFNLNLAPKDENISACLSQGYTLADYNNLTFDPYYELLAKMYESVQANEELGKLLIEIKYKQAATIVDQTDGFRDDTRIELLHVRNISFCNRKTRKVLESSTSLRYFSLYLLNQVASVTKLNQIYSDPADWKDDECICEVILNMHNVVSVLMEQSNVLVSREELYSDSVENNIIIIFSIIVPVVFFVFLIPFIVGYVKMNSEFQQIFDILNLLPIKIYKEASKPIAIFPADLEQSTEAVNQIEHKGCQKALVIVPGVVSSILISGGLIGIFFVFRDVNYQFNTLVKWLEIGSLRTPLVIEIVTHAILAGIYGFLGTTDYTSHEHHLNLLANYSAQLINQHKLLIYDDDNFKACNGFNKRLDDLHYTNTCVIDLKGKSFQINYRCLSIDQQIVTFQKLANDVYLTMRNAKRNSLITPEGYDMAFRNILNDYECINLHFLGITYLFPKLEAAQDVLNEGIDLQIGHLKEYSLIITLLVLAAEFIIFVIELFVINNLKEEYNVVRILIARLPPMSVVTNKQLVELITGQINNKKSWKISPARIHIRNCSNSIVIFNKDGKIQLINSATSKLFGFTKEQLYQSDISMIIRSEDSALIKDMCNRFMKQYKPKTKSSEKNKHSSEIQQVIDDNENDELLASLLNTNDNDNLDLNNSVDLPSENVDLYNNPYRTQVVGIKDGETKAILSVILTYLPEPDDVFALIMRDETSIYINDDDSKQAKRQAEEILNQVLPRPIIDSNKLKHNISFSVKHVSVITVKILNFNENIPHLTSVQVIRNMTELFLNFDVNLEHYANLTKTCVISDQYQAIGGLFEVNSIKSDALETDSFNGNDESQTENGSTKGKSREAAGDNLSISINNSSSEAIDLSRNTSIVSITQADSTLTADSTNATSNNNSSIIANNNNGSNENASNNNNNSIIANNNNGNDANADNNSIANNNSSIASNNGSNENANNNNDNNEVSSSNNDPNTNAKSDQNSSKTDSVSMNEKSASSNHKDQASTPAPSAKRSSSPNITITIPSNNNNNVDPSTAASASPSSRSTASSPGSCRVTYSDDNPSLDVLSGRSQRSGSIKVRPSIYEVTNLSRRSHEKLTSVILDSIYFAFNCLSANEYINNQTGTNFVVGVGINIGGPVTAGTLGKEHMQFNVVGEAVKVSQYVSCAAEAGNIVITADVYMQIKDVEEAKKNFVFTKYKKVDLLHSKTVQTFIVKPSEELKKEAQLEDVYDEQRIEEEEEEKELPEALNTSDVPLDQQMQEPEELHISEVPLDQQIQHPED